MSWAAGQHTDTATAEGDYNSVTYDDTDDANYYGVGPEIDVEKYVSVDGGSNWLDADTATGPNLATGTDPQFRFVVTNTGDVTLTGIDLVTGRTERQIETGHATLVVTANQDEIMVAVGPTAQERIAALEGSVLTVAVADSPWTNPSPDPALNWNPRVRQMLFNGLIYDVHISTNKTKRTDT